MRVGAQTLAGWGVAVAAACVFAATASRDVDPELSAPLLADLLRLSPFPSMEYPVWSWIARALAGVAGPAFPHVLSLFSAACGALVVGLLYFLVRDSLRETEVLRHAPLLPVAAGLSASVFLLVSMPFWMAASRPHPAPFDLALLLGALRLLQGYALHAKPWRLHAFALLYGVGIAELATFLLFLPAIGLFALYLMWRNRHLTARILLAALGCGALGVSLFFAGVADYFRLPAAAWREASSYTDMLMFQLLDRKRLLLGSIPRHGWLLLFMGTLLPWAAAWMAMRRHRGWGGSPSVLLLYAVLLGITLVVLFNGPVAPWRVLGSQPFLVTPYVLAATTYGYLAARFGTMAVQRLARFKRPAGFVAPAVLAAALAPLAWAGVQHAPQVAPSAARAAAAVTRAALVQAEGRTLWIGNGLLEPLLQIETRRLGLPFDYVNVYQCEALTYRRYLASRFAEPRLQSLAIAGLGPLLAAWVNTGDDAARRLALAWSPDLWLSEGWEPVPAGLVFLAAPDRDALKPEAWMERHRSFWREVETALPLLRAAGPRSRALAEALAQQASRVANDLGVALENLDQPGSALAAYRQSLALEPRNVSAALNLLVLARTQAPDLDLTDAETLRVEESTRAAPRSPGALAHEYGHLRTAEAAALLGAADGPSAAELPPALLDVIQAYRAGRRDEARAKLERLLLDQPGLAAGWILLASIAYEQGQPDGMDRAVAQMKKMGQEWPPLLVLLGRARLQANEPAAARAYLERAATLRPGDLTVQQVLLELDLKDRAWSEVDRRLQRILAVQPNHEKANLALAALLRERKRHDLAEDVLRRLLQYRRASGTLAQLSTLLLARGDTDGALAAAEESVARGANDVEARMARARVLVALERWPEAGREWEAARAIDPSSVAVALELVRWRSQSGDVAGAAALARELLAAPLKRTEDEERELRRFTEK
jgi:tetratricopeptide (TPR) repeat protein